MTTPASPLLSKFAADQAIADQKSAQELLGALIQPSQYVGEVISLGYTQALVQIHAPHLLAVVVMKMHKRAGARRL